MSLRAKLSSPLHVLFVCSRNKKRSLTAEVHFAQKASFEVASAGLNRDSATPVTADLLKWADIIFVTGRTSGAPGEEMPSSP